jgi:CxxC motif-containing protein (DUF1111 family)
MTRFLPLKNNPFKASPQPALAVLLACAALFFSGCFVDSGENSDEAPRAGGAMTIVSNSNQAFSFPAPSLSVDALDFHNEGDAGFEAAFVSAPASINPGLGPLFNATSCTGCHAGDGRGRPPLAGGEALGGMLFRISAAGTDAHGGPNRMPGYGGQLQDRALFGHVPEGTVRIQYRDSVVPLSEGESVTLRIPTYTLENLWKPLPSPPLLSPRVAPPVFGLGLLEAVSEATILERADAADANADGVSGRANYVFDVKAGAARIGKFGWKSNNPSLLQQVAGAYNNDMGVTTPYFPVENCDGDREACFVHDPDVDSLTLAQVTFYVQTLAVPARRIWNDPTVQRGEKLFKSSGCAACHAPELRTGAVAAEPWRSNQTIRPYTDLLLHDMGDGLGDGRPDYLASGNEWRTPALWGLGLSGTVNGHTFLLHDGRARNVLEAVIWHGGEAAAAREKVRALSPGDRAALLAFLNSL